MMPFDKARAMVDESTLNHEERLGLAYCRLNGWEWDELFGPKPDGWDTMPDYEYPYTYGSKRKVYPTKYDYTKPMMHALERILGEAKCSYYHWRFNLNRSYDEWLQWYVCEKYAGENEPESKGYLIPKAEAAERLKRSKLVNQPFGEAAYLGDCTEGEERCSKELKKLPHFLRRFFFKKQ